MLIVYLLVSVMPLTQHPVWTMVAGQFTVIKYLGGASLAYALVHLVHRGAMPRIFSPWLVRWFVALASIATLSYWSKGARPWQISPFGSYLSFCLLLFVVIACIDTLGRFRTMLLVATGSVAFASLYVIREWQVNHNMYPGFRPGWITGDANYYSISVVLTLPLAFILIRTLRASWQRWLCIGSLGVSLIGLMLAASRGAFLGLLAAAVFLVLRSPKPLRNLLLIASVLLPLVTLAPASPVRRLLHPTGGDQGAADRRVQLWKVGLNMVREHPIVGIGLGNYKSLMDGYERDYRVAPGIAHNTYLEVAAELGFIGISVFAALLVSSFRSIERTRKLALLIRNSEVAQFCLAMEAGFVGFAVSALFLSAEYQKLFWLLVFLTVRVSMTVQSAARAAAQRRPGASWAPTVPVVDWPITGRFVENG